MRVRYEPNPVCDACANGCCDDCEGTVLDGETDNYAACTCVCGGGAEMWVAQ